MALDGLLDSGQPCQAFPRFLKDGDEYTPVATSERATQDRFRRA
ncbi:MULTISPECIES: hypothetical protein [Kitasatospora]